MTTRKAPPTFSTSGMPRDELFTLEDHAVRACLAAVARDLAQHSAVALHRGCRRGQQFGHDLTQPLRTYRRGHGGVGDGRQQRCGTKVLRARGLHNHIRPDAPAARPLPVSRFTSRNEQRHLGGLCWSAITNGLHVFTKLFTSITSSVCGPRPERTDEGEPACEDRRDVLVRHDPNRQVLVRWRYPTP